MATFINFILTLIFFGSVLGFAFVTLARVDYKREERGQYAKHAHERALKRYQRRLGYHRALLANQQNGFCAISRDDFYSLIDSPVIRLVLGLLSLLWLFVTLFLYFCFLGRFSDEMVGVLSLPAMTIWGLTFTIFLFFTLSQMPKLTKFFVRFDIVKKFDAWVASKNTHITYQDGQYFVQADFIQQSLNRQMQAFETYKREVACQNTGKLSKMMVFVHRHHFKLSALFLLAMLLSFALTR